MEKTCADCAKRLPLVDFHSKGKRRDGVCRRCRQKRRGSVRVAGPPCADCRKARSYSSTWAAKAAGLRCSTCHAKRAGAASGAAVRGTGQDAIGWVYFVRPVGGGPIKIGVTGGDVPRRLSELQCGSPVLLELACVVRAPRTAEGRIHHRFAFARMHGEWFRPVPNLLRFMERVRDRDELTLDELEQHLNEPNDLPLFG